MRPVKIEELKEMETILNRFLEKHNLKVSINPRCDYLGIDMYDLKDKMEKTLMTGNKKEAYFYLSGFIDSMEV